MGGLRGHMKGFSKVLKLLADTRVLKTIGDMSSVIDGYLELGPEERCDVARNLSEYAEVLIHKIKQDQQKKQPNKQEDVDNGTEHRL